MIELLRLLIVRVLYRNRVILGKNVRFEGIPTFVINKGGHIEVGDDVVVRKLVELRATKGAKINIGSGVKLDRLVRIIATNGKDVTLGNRVKVGVGTVINGGDTVEVGENSLISGYVYLQSSMHDHRGPSDISSNGYKYGKISIGKGSWIGVHAVIFPDVSLGEGVVVGSNSVVNKSFSQGAVVGGVPAKEILSNK